MYYEGALQFLLGTLQKCGIPAYTVRATEVLTDTAQMGLQLLTGGDTTIEQVLDSTAASTVYTLKDRFGCNYIYFRLPETSQSIQIIGPYAQERLSSGVILSLAEQFRLSPKETAELRRYLGSVVLLPDDSPVHFMLEQFYETLWGPGGYDAVNTDSQFDLTVIPHKDPERDDSLWNAKLLEQRYAKENAMMDAVTHGQLHKVERSFNHFSPDLLEERTPDTLRNTKNYCIILNTLLRKAAERGGVHPSYIDRISTDFAIRIEKLPAVSHAATLMKDMLRSYCRLVQSQKTAEYPALIQRAILLIDEDLSADLSLRGLAEKLSISGGYLSSLFKKKTGQTVTEFITDRRINLAKHLLKTTSLQIQTIAQHCGFPDVNYFSKTFKKLTATTPMAYRAER